MNLPAGDWSVLANAQRAGTEPVGAVDGSVTVPPWSLVVLAR
jgi:hypothetical protein